MFMGRDIDGEEIEVGAPRLFTADVARHALELGVDVGALDAVVCVGWPGTRAALWQRFGRAGRRQGESLAALINELRQTQ
mgnify:CR=1 FL=1